MPDTEAARDARATRVVEREARAARLAEIDAAGRATRRTTPRGVWVAAAIVGAICAIGFAIAMLGRADPGTRLEQRGSGSAGLAAGIAIGLAAGIAIGYALGRQRARAGSSGAGSQSADSPGNYSSGDHSSRSNP